MDVEPEYSGFKSALFQLIEIQILLKNMQYHCKMEIMVLVFCGIPFCISPEIKVFHFSLTNFIHKQIGNFTRRQAPFLCPFQKVPINLAGLVHA